MPAVTAQDLRIGRVISVQVPRREVRIHPESDVPQRFEQLTVARFRDPRGGRHAWPVRAFRTAGANVVLVLDGPTDTQMAELRGTAVVIDPSERGTLPDGDFFYDDMIGAAVVDAAGTVLGEVTGITESPLYPLLDVRGANGRAYTIACVAAHVHHIDTAQARITVDPTYLLDEDGHAY